MLFADDARKILQNLPMRIPKPVLNLLALDNVRWKTIQRETVIWLQAVNGDPITGRKLKDISAELFPDEDEEEEDDDEFEPGQSTPGGRRPRMPKPDVTIEDPVSVGMPRVNLDALSDIAFTVSSAESRHCRVATRWEVRGRHTGTLLGVPATDKSVTVTGVTLLKFTERPGENGKEAFAATEEWTCWDLPSLLEQLRETP
jgi:hypothetical protein